MTGGVDYNANLRSDRPDLFPHVVLEVVPVPEALDKVQAALDRLTRRWWFYLLLLVVFFLPLYAEKGYDPRQTAEVIAEVMPNGTIYSFPALWPVFKVIPLLLLAALLFLRRRAARAFAVYVALLSVLLPFGQCIARTPHTSRRSSSWPTRPA